MSRYCLDTSAYSHFMRGEPRVVELVDGAEWIGIPPATVAELRVGFLLGRCREENEGLLKEFLENPAVEELVADHSIAEIFAEVFVDLRRAGTPIPTNDIWIAAQAIRAGATVLTYDDHFNRIARVGSLILPRP